MLLLAPEQQLRRHLANLTDAAWRHFELFGEGRLNGIDDHDIGLDGFGSRQDFLHAHFRIDMKTSRPDAEALSAHPDLLSGLLTGRIEHSRMSRQTRSNVEHQRRFAD